jgi:hypothetical protein
LLTGDYSYKETDKEQERNRSKGYGSAYEDYGSSYRY